MEIRKLINLLRNTGKIRWITDLKNNRKDIEEYAVCRGPILVKLFMVSVSDKKYLSNAYDGIIKNILI